jgi:CheY-like chemotaxis protein
MKILIVDDNSRVRALLRSMLASTESEFFEAADGVEGIATFTSQHPDLVLMDIKMPNMDGIEATRRIKRDWPWARVVMVTDYDESSLRALARLAGAEQYFLKDDLSRLPAYILRTG